MEELNHLFDNFSLLFDEGTPLEEKKKVGAAIAHEVEGKMTLINKIANKKTRTRTRTETIYL